MASSLLGTAALVASVATIYLRGYLVPGTPALTTQYLPDRIPAWFDKATRPRLTCRRCSAVVSG